MELSRTTRLWLMLSLSTAYFLTELVVGIVSNSMALAADAFHMLSDVLAMAVGIVAIRAASSTRAEAYRHNTYGLQRAELLGALANSVFLLALCFTIVIDAVKRLLEPAPLRHPEVVLAVGLTASIMLNGVPSGVDVSALRRAIVAIPAVTAVHELHVWQLSDTKRVGSAHVTVASLGAYMDTAVAVKRVFHAAGVHATTIQPELLLEGDPRGGGGAAV
eukprot:contig_14119_g3384